MNQTEFLAWLAELLEKAGIPFMVAGSISSNLHSQPRTTNDVDVVIDPSPTQLEHFLVLLGDQVYVSPEAAHDALRGRSMFNIIDLVNGFKADLIVRKNRPFSLEEFARRKSLTLEGHLLPFASAEDVILSKLEWNKITPSERQIRDALNVAVAQWRTLDQVYLRKWAPTLGVADQLQKLLTAAEKDQPPPSV